ncbi:MAG: hypothetical protein ACW981_12635 [Candidatus Hodarchaeales archaeon]|jgi:hypothetical protein
MIFRRKELPEPFKKSLIKSLKEIKEITNLDNPNKLKNFNFASAFLYMKGNKEFTEFANISDQMERLNIIYQFLNNFDENNNIIDNHIHVSSLEGLNEKKIDPVDYMRKLASSNSVNDLKKVLLDNSDLKQIQVKNSDKSYIELRKKLEKEYRKEHKQITKKLNKMRSRSR